MSCLVYTFFLCVLSVHRTVCLLVGGNVNFCLYISLFFIHMDVCLTKTLWIEVYSGDLALHSYNTVGFTSHKKLYTTFFHICRSSPEVL